MPFDVRKISVSIAVISFFGLSIVMLICGLPPFTCCKRAIIGSFIVYIIAAIAVKLVNIILIDAMLTRQAELEAHSEKSKKAKQQG